MGSRRKKIGVEAGAMAKLPAKARSLLRRLHGSLSHDLRHRDYPVHKDELYWATLGHCYIATEALYHLWGKDAGYVPHVLRHKHGTHWWLVHAETGEVIDPTEPQLDGEPFPYELGHKQQLLTTMPSRRARELMRRMSCLVGGSFMANAFIAYWKPETADFNLERGEMLDHAASEQFRRVEPGDHVWIVTVRNRELFVLGRIVVGHVVGQDKAAQLLGRNDLWKASRHIVAADGTAEPLREVSIPGLAETFRFESSNDRLAVADDLVSAQQLQTMRVLTPDCATELEAAFRRAV